MNCHHLSILCAFASKSVCSCFAPTVSILIALIVITVLAGAPKQDGEHVLTKFMLHICSAVRSAGSEDSTQDASLMIDYAWVS